MRIGVRSRLLVALLSVTVVAAAGCTGGATGAPPSPTASPFAVKTLGVCFGPMPRAWSSLVPAGAVLPGVDFNAYVLDAEGNVFGTFTSGSGMGVAEYSGRFTVIDSMPATASGASWMSYARPWLVWVQGDSQAHIGRWSVHAWNSQSGEKLQLGTSQLADGTYLENQLTFPVVGPDFVAWSTPTSTTSADLRLYSFISRQSITLDSGRLSSPVIAGPNLVWAKFDSTAGSPSFKMVDGRTLKAVPIPTALSGPQPITFLAGSKDYLAWTAWIYGKSADGLPATTSRLTVERLKDGELTRYQLRDGDVKHNFQFPVLAGHFLVWFTSTENAVLDLQTGQGFDLGLPSTITGNDREIIVARTSGGGSKNGGSGAGTAISSIQLTPDLGIKSC